MSDAFDREKYAAAYRAIADVFEHDRTIDQPESHLSFILGDLSRRVFVGTQFDPPDEIFEQVVDVLRRGDSEQSQKMAQKLREHAEHLDEIG